MRRIEALLAEYGESHQDKTNKLVHWICVPLIVWTVLAFLWELPFPGRTGWMNWATVVLIASLVYYLVLSPPLAIGMAAYAAISLTFIRAYEANVALPLWQFAAILFVIAWIGQFWGHKIEGKKPSFLKDVQFLLIGPAWLLSFLYRRFGIPY